MVSSHPGLIPQISGYLTGATFWAATIFVDHWSNFTYVQLQRGTSQVVTLQPNTPMRAWQLPLVLRVRRYHSDNSRFAEQPFQEAVEANNWNITFCGVGAHHQNGIAERKTRTLTETARTILLHAKQRWPEMVTTNLWPFALKTAAERKNTMMSDENGMIFQSEERQAYHWLPSHMGLSCICPRS